MRRTSPQLDPDSGQDSFLDVVSNIVGILIILVVVVGAQVKTGFHEAKLREIAEEQADSQPVPTPEPAPAPAPVPAPAPDPGDVQAARELESELASALQQEAALRAEIVGVRENSERLEAERQLLLAESVQLEAGLNLVRGELESLTSAEDVRQREIFELTRRSLELDKTAELLRKQLENLTTVAGRDGGPKQIEHKTTPIIRSVESRESHFIVDAGRIMYVPLDELLAEYQRRLNQITYDLLQSGARTEILGPYSGFRLHTETRLQGGGVGVFWKILPPPIAQSGEAIPVALAPVSQFRHRLEKLDPGRDILTFWIYPSGFECLPELKAEAYRLGFSIASRPLPEGMPIAGSPDGQRSVAQ